jgi:hypothetical protein
MLVLHANGDNQIMILPTSLAAIYRPAADHEVRSWSFGALKRPRPASEATWQDQRGTLHDQAIFGPLQPFNCACGKYRGARHKNMICDICGAKVTTPDVRRRRFGHIDLAAAVAHPLGTKGEMMASVPVMPAVFWQTKRGEPLIQIYDHLTLHSANAPVANKLNQRNGHAVGPLLEQLMEVLLPVATFAVEWTLAESDTFAHGLALERRDSEP